MHQSAFVHFGRLGGRPTAKALLSAGSGRPTEEFSSVFFLNGYILFCLFLGLFPIALLDFLLMFSSPINSWTIENPLTRFLKVRSSFYKFTSRFSFFLKDFFLSQNFIFLIFSLSLSSTYLQAISTTQS